jgi:hypothetical protein
LTETGEVSREIVIDVLVKQGVTVTPKLVDDSRRTVRYVLQKNDLIEEQTFGTRVGRRMLHYLDRRFKVPIHLFFNPSLTPAKPIVVKPKSA